MYRLPDGAATDSAEHYGEEWRDFGSAVEMMLPGYKLDAFDPDLRFTRSEVGADGKEYNMATITLSVDSVQRLWDFSEEIKQAMSIIDGALQAMQSDTHYRAYAKLALDVSQNIQRKLP